MYVCGCFDFDIKYMCSGFDFDTHQKCVLVLDFDTKNVFWFGL